jgi:hypothetical protein
MRLSMHLSELTSSALHGFVHASTMGSSTYLVGEGGGDEAHFEDGGGRDGQVEC